MLQGRGRLIRPPREEERAWNNHNVDMNLNDAWLEALNSLRTYNLISICEGHVSGGRGIGHSRPHINLRIKEQYIPLLVRKIDDVSNDMQLRLVELFGYDDTIAEMKYTIKFTSSRRRQNIERDLVVSINFNISRQTQEIDTETRKWFEKIINNIRKYDNFTESKLKCERG